jgi:hypothetical protein
MRGIGSRLPFSRRFHLLERLGGIVKVEGLSLALVQERRRRLARQRAFGPPDLARLEAILAAADAVLPLAAADAVLPLAAALPGFPPDGSEATQPHVSPAGGTRALQTPANQPAAGRIVYLRHDLDSDIENALPLAEWEAAHGWRATYCVLHTDWYYRRGSQGPPSRLVLRVLERIAHLGHEVALHNNAIAAGLLLGRDPAEVLATELGHLRRAGFAIQGTSAHGDRLCHLLGFNNGEVFVETPRPTLGAADRTIAGVDPQTGRALRVILRPRPLAAFGLRYEASFVPHRQYLADSHGRWSRPPEDLLAILQEGGGPVQILVHPVWWALRGEGWRPRPATPAPAEPPPTGSAAG